jgi:enterochelin esterase-like enzyme
MWRVSSKSAIAVVAVVLLAGALAAYLTVLHGDVGLLAFRNSETYSTTVHSVLLGRDMPVEIFRPAEAEGCANAPLLYLFHGSGANQDQWMNGDFGTGVGVDSVARRLIDAGQIQPVTIVSAMIDKSYGVNSPPGDDVWSHGPYESYIMDELLPTIERTYPIRSGAQRAIGGLSMGGFAALNAAFRYPDLFSRVAGLSPAFFVSPPADRAWIYSGGHDLLTLATEEQYWYPPRVFLGYGDSDFSWVRQATGELANRLNARGNDVQPLVVSGGHDVGTWRQLAEPMLRDLFTASGFQC